MTVEVRHDTKLISQARGKCNAALGDKHRGILRRWAEQAGLRLRTTCDTRRQLILLTESGRNSPAMPCWPPSAPKPQNSKTPSGEIRGNTVPGQALLCVGLAMAAMAQDRPCTYGIVRGWSAFLGPRNVLAPAEWLETGGGRFHVVSDVLHRRRRHKAHQGTDRERSEIRSVARGVATPAKAGIRGFVRGEVRTARSKNVA